MVNISRYFLASAQQIASQCTNHDVIYEAMKRTMKTSMEYKRAINVKNLYKELKIDGIGTAKVETMSRKLCDTLPKHRRRTLVRIVINWKLRDAYKELRELKIRNTEVWRQEKETLAAAGVREEYERLWRREITHFENSCTIQRKKKIDHLRRKFKKREVTVPDDIEGIVVSDQVLPAEYNSTPTTYGGITLSDNERCILALPPKYATYETINKEQCEAQIEKALAKLRWEEKRNAVDPDGNELPPEERNWHEVRTKTMDFRKLRSTDLPFNSRICAPQPLDNQTETCLQNLKIQLNQCTARYIEMKQRTENQLNLTTEQQEGLRSLKEKRKSNEIIIFETDKSKRFSCDSMDNYKTLGVAHTTEDETITIETISQYEKEINAHAENWIRILSAGTETNNYDRIRTSMKSRNNPPSPLSVLRKDHKPYEDEFIGPPGRPVCGGDVSYNKRLSHLISMLLTDVYRGEKTVCSSTEELLAEVRKLNDEGIDDLDIVGSMDVEALYPSLDIDFTVEKVCEVLYESAVKFEGVDYKELGLYLSLVKNDDELRRMGLLDVCPKRRYRRGPRPNITGCGTKEDAEERHRPWIFPNISAISYETKREMFVEAVRIVLKVLLETHTYEFAEVIKRQRKGGPIGMELTGVVAQIFMVWWDKEFVRRLNDVNIRLRLHERYVDDTNLSGKQTQVGARYESGQITITEESRLEDTGVPKDERTMKLLQSIANSIHHSIRMTIDYPSKHADGKVPMLNVKLWIEEIDGQRRLLYEHYEKEMTTKNVIHATSAIPKKTKRTVLTQDALRIMLHCSRYLPWETVLGHLNKLMMKMQYSGYDKKFRYEVANLQ